MDKIIVLQTQQGKANILASSIDGFITGIKGGTGYVLIKGVGTPITECFTECVQEWKEWFKSNLPVEEKLFEFKNIEDQSITVRLDDVKSIRSQDRFSVIHLTDNISISSRENYCDLCDRFAKAIK